MRLYIESATQAASTCLYIAKGASNEMPEGAPCTATVYQPSHKLRKIPILRCGQLMAGLRIQELHGGNSVQSGGAPMLMPMGK